MKLLSAILLPMALAADSTAIHNITLTRCGSKATRKDYDCVDKRPQVIFPIQKDDISPSWSHHDGGATVLEWTAPYTLGWESNTNASVTFEWATGEDGSLSFIYQKIPAGANSMDFTFEEIASAASISKNVTDRERLSMVLGQASIGNSLSLTISEPTVKSFAIGSLYNDIFIQHSESFMFWEQEIATQQAKTKASTPRHKKWRLGVGIAVGLGVPILMAASYMAGKVQATKKAEKRYNHVDYAPLQTQV